MALLTPEFIEAHPVKSGLAWAAGMAPLLGAIMIVTGRSPTPLWIAELIGLSIAGGVLWGFSVRAINRRRAAQ
jgi:hypothetical protein